MTSVRPVETPHWQERIRDALYSFGRIQPGKTCGLHKKMQYIGPRIASGVPELSGNYGPQLYKAGMIEKYREIPHWKQQKREQAL